MPAPAKPKKKIRVVFELVAVLEDDDWFGSGEPYYRATVNGIDTGKSKVFTSDQIPGNVLPADQFSIELDVDDDPGARIDVSFKGSEEDVFSDDYLGEVRQSVPADTKQSFATTSDSGKFILFWRVEPLDVVGGPIPGPISVSRLHFKSTSFTTLAAERVQIGVLVRGCWGESHEPPIMAQHADMTLPTATGNHRTLVGFFAEPAPATLRGKTSLGSIKPELNEYAGIVYKDAVFMAKRPHYYDAPTAKSKKIPSLFCKLEVLASQAKLVMDTWKEWEANPPNFIFLGENCSNKAAISLAAGHVLSHIQGLDTPYNLYRTLKKIYGSSLKCEAGYAGFDGGEYKIVHPLAPGDQPAQDAEASIIDVLQTY